MLLLALCSPRVRRQLLSWWRHLLPEVAQEDPPPLRRITVATAC